MIDLHAHILPGLDDGPPTLDASAEMAAAAVAAGTRVMAATSHINRSFGLLPEDLAPARAQVAERLREAAAEVAAAGVPVRTHHREGDAADAILDVAEERGADLIVVGNKGMTGAKRFLLGSVPNKVSHHAPCSVLIIRTT